MQPDDCSRNGHAGIPCLLRFAFSCLIDVTVCKLKASADSPTPFMAMLVLLCLSRTVPRPPRCAWVSLSSCLQGTESHLPTLGIIHFSNLFRSVGCGETSCCLKYAPLPVSLMTGELAWHFLFCDMSFIYIYLFIYFGADIKNMVIHMHDHYLFLHGFYI